MHITPKQSAPFGSWPSPLSAEDLAAGVRPLSCPRITPSGIVWLEGLPAESGRVVARQADREGVRTRTPAGFNLRSKVHEYGGGACIAEGDLLYFCNFSDQRVYVQQGQATPQPLDSGKAATQRHADLELDHHRQRLLAVREDHGTGAAQPRSSLVSLPAKHDAEAPFTLMEGHDFYAAPRLSPDGQQLAWLAWNHPQMPWQGCELWLASVDAAGHLQQARHIAGSATEALVQPLWSPSGDLYVCSDRSGYWNLYRVNLEQGTDLQPLSPMAAEFARPMWVFGQSTYGFTAKDQITAAVIDQGVASLVRIRLRPGPLPGADMAADLTALPSPCSDITELRAGPGFVIVQAANATTAEQIIRIDVASGQHQVLASSLAKPPPAAMLSAAQPIQYASAGGRVAHAFFHPPCNAGFQGLPGSLPPLIVTSHGGPTSMSAGSLRLGLQFWTSRGFAVLDVNYGGSSGFGRDYRQLLDGQWGIVDVEDCVYGAQHLADRGLVDGKRMAIRGGSASGFTTLCALAFHDVFAAGASHYGVSDLATLDADTHKFESHYSATLVASKGQTAAERAAIYTERSPLHHAARIRAPMIFFQGLDDRVVPPAQSLAMVQALRAQGVRADYHAYAGEGHGFRRQATITACLEAELAFYGEVFGFQPTAPPPSA